MNCPACHAADTSVIDSRAYRDGVRRRRQCDGCGHRFTTRELCDEIVAGHGDALAALTRQLEAALADARRVLRVRRVRPGTGRPRGRPVETNAADLVRCERCGAQVWREDFEQHVCGTVEDTSFEKLAERLQRI